MSNPYPPDPYGQPGGSEPYQQQPTNYSQYPTAQPYGADPYGTSGQPYGADPYGQSLPMQPVYAPPVQPVIVAQPQTNSKALISLILGICSYAGFVIFTGVPAIILGHMAMREITRSNGAEGGKTLALVGLILGYVATIGTIAVCGFFVLLFLGLLGSSH